MNHFHQVSIKGSYSSREVDQSWCEMVSQMCGHHTEEIAVDVGCGGGIYSVALLSCGFKQVVGIDDSDVMLQDAREFGKLDRDRLRVQKGTASHSTLPTKYASFVLQRALIHHLEDLQPAFKEAYRILKEGGQLLIQDRTLEDCSLLGSHEHIRGYFFECFPFLLEIEQKKRHRHEDIMVALKDSGFSNIKKWTYWETRSVTAKDKLLQDLLKRTGRSILHHLTDAQLNELVTFINTRLPNHQTINEKDRWTIWFGEK